MLAAMTATTHSVVIRKTLVAGERVAGRFMSRWCIGASGHHVDGARGIRVGGDEVDERLQARAGIDRWRVNLNRADVRGVAQDSDRGALAADLDD
jgi:hypothetical protein